MNTEQSPATYQKASTVVLPHGSWETVLDCLCHRFPNVSRLNWLSRFERGLVLDSRQRPLEKTAPYGAGIQIYYFRENPQEDIIPGQEVLLYQDDHLLVVDKPPFLPVIPTGKYVSQTLLARLIHRCGNPDLQPLHRIDRHTSGLVVFSKQKKTRGIYQALFRDKKIEKSYLAIAPALSHLEFPYHHHSRIVRGEPFFLSQEVPGPVNSHTIIDVIDKSRDHWLYALNPVSGKKHQLRLHMSSLGAPICNDYFYPVVNNAQLDNYSQPLQLLAAAIHFTDPTSGKVLSFTSRQELQWRHFST